MASLFEPFRLRGLELRNRLALSPEARPQVGPMYQVPFAAAVPQGLQLRAAA
jgi:2,4-dienoyl-CoA reductase-like NADH-dependent reductase (Old Yellow Enzyme family)